MAFELDPRLARSSVELGRLGRCRVLLKDNAHFRWLLLVPEVEEGLTELHDLPDDLFREVCGSARELSAWVKQSFAVDKVNVAAIGNIVSQLHIHVAGRFQSDPAWPGTVWACEERRPFTPEELATIQAAFIARFGSV